jgi:iron complex transport system permease protein
MPVNHRIEQRRQYDRFIKRKRLIFVIAVLVTAITAVFAISAGSLNISLPDVMSTLFGGGDKMYQAAILGIRLPRIITAILVGAILASSGAVMQCVLQNPLASASTLGVSQGAAFGAAVGLVVFSGGIVNSDSAATAISISNPYIVTLCAFVFGSLSTLVIILLSQFRKDLGPAGLILAGVALSSLFGGGLTLLQFFADETKISSIVFWTFGNLGSAGWTEIAILALVCAASLIYYLLNRWNYNAMEAGADTAKSLGVNSRAVMLISLGICSLSAAVAVSFVGIISFVGLIAPHIMRRFVGNDYRYLLPCSAVAGALLLILADTFGRLIIAPVILPIGAITSFLGAPLFLFLLLKGFKTNV